MSRSFNGKEYTYFHNGDFSGNIDIVTKGSMKFVSIPFEDLKGLVAKYVRNKEVSKLENMEIEELLLKLKGESPTEKDIIEILISKIEDLSSKLKKGDS